MTAPHLAPGTVLAGRSYNFSIQALVAHCGSSATFRALSSAGGEAMVKVYDPAVRQRPDITQAMERVYAETMQLPGDVIVQVLEAGYDPSTGAPFSATAFVQLPSVAQLVSRRPLSPAEVTGMLKSLARGLDAAHIRQVSHHALKPSNVFLGGAPNFEARLTDFGAGLVRLAVPTHDGYALSAPWLAPEQVQQGGQPGPAADIFSAALVAFFALTGRSFWRSCQGQTPDLNAWQQELFGGRSVASLRASEIGIPLNAALDPVFSRALQVDPRQRYRTVGELAAAFDAAANQREAAGATMAFPAIDMAPPPAQQQQQPYTPTTQVSAGQQAQQPQQAWGAQQAQPGMQPVPGQGMPSMPDQQPPQPHVPASAAAMTMVPQAIDRPRARASKAVPIFLGITALVLVGGAVAAFAFLGKDDSSGAAAGSGAAASVPVPTAPAAATETPSSTAAAEPSATATATAEAAPAEVQITIACKPGCDAVQINGTAVGEVTKPAKVPAGEHTLTASKEGYTTFEEKVLVEIAEGGGSAKVTFTKEGSPAQTTEVKDLTKPLEHKIALALAPAAKSTGAAAAAPTGTTTRTATATGVKTKPGCKSKFGVGCK